MNELKDSLLRDIQTGLHECWMEAKKSSINVQINAIPGTDAASGALRSRKRKALTEEASRDFEACWSHVANGVAQQYDIFHQIAEDAVLARHPWLRFEEPSTQESLKNIFLRRTLEHLLFDLLEDKPAKAKKWGNILINPEKQFKWGAINHRSLADQIEGYPLSDPNFYNDRPLPSYLELPFSQSPMRYDLYRLLKKTYEGSFKAKTLSNGVVSTAIAPLHYNELRHLTSEEWNNFETILLNIGAEEDPEWVLLDKKKGNWTIYAPPSLENRCQGIPGLSEFQFQGVNHVSHTVYSEVIDWHAVLLSRVLPWCRSTQAQKPPLEEFRATIPVPLLLQNALESSCLPAQKKDGLASQKAFAKRRPFSLLDSSDLYSAELRSVPPETTYLFPAIPETPASTVINALDARDISYDPTENKLSITNPDQFLEAMKLAYYQRVKKLELFIQLEDSTKRWFEYNLDITRIESISSPQYSYAHACAARNRFLANTDFFTRNPNNIEASKIAWEKTGSYIYQLFKNNPRPHSGQLASIAEMGKEGLDVFFTFVNTVSKPALSCTFDLNSGQTIESSDYIDHLVNKIQSCKKRPLFTKLDLILPQPPLTEATQAALIALIGVLNARGEMTELTLHNPAGVSLEFITRLKDLATPNPNPFLLQLKIPEWDETVAANPQSGSLKANYRELQNMILANIRRGRESQLQANTLSIHRPLLVRHLKRTSPVAEDASWRLGKVYKLSSGGVGVQQQAQQEVAQDVQQDAEQQKPAKSAEREIGLFAGGEIITRHNVDSYGTGATGKDFSAWVGSKVDASFVIQGMDPAAFRKIQEFPSLFQFGVDWKNTPGFRLNYLNPETKELILTYDPTLESEDIENQKLEPFAIQLNYNQHATPFCGDYRQFHTLTVSGVDTELTVWHHLANETLSQSIQDWLVEQGCDPSTSESMQYRDVTTKMNKSSDQATLIAMIKDWSRSKLALIEQPGDRNDEAFLAALFDEMTPENLRAFGQLFYHYDVKGSDNFLYLAHQMYHKFPNPDHFTIYKKHFLNPVADWSECLAKEEVEAFTSSMQKLDAHPAYQNIFWTLIDAHGNTVVKNQDGNVIPMHYAEVWRAFDRVIDYIDTNNLKISETEFCDAILQYTGEFNASQFLRRLYEVLQQTGNKPDSTKVQNEILGNLSRIDWYENGFYYACVHENFPYWDRALALSGLQRLDNLVTPTYGVTWDNSALNISDELGFTLRYAAQRLKLPKIDFDTFKTTLSTITEFHPRENAALFRLMTTSIALGLDTVDTIAGLEQNVWEQLSSPGYQAILLSLNQELHLDSKELMSQSYQLKISDLPILVEVLAEVGLANLPELDLTIINAFGRALQSFSGDKKSQLLRLIQFGREFGFEHPLVTAYPWLVTEAHASAYPNNPEQMKFYQQLSSIHFASSILPNQATLAPMIAGIETTEDRHQAVRALIELGCNITDQDAEFRLLKPTEKRLLDGVYLSKTFGGQNRLLLAKLFEHLAIKEEGDTQEKINKLLSLFTHLDRKSYYDELGQLLGLLVEKSRNNHYYSVEQLTTWISTVFDENAFKTKPYPISLINALLTNALQDPNSSLINQNLHQLTTHDASLEPLQAIMAHINLSHLSDRAKQTLAKFAIEFKSLHELEMLFARVETIFNQSAAWVAPAICDFITIQLKRNPQILLQNLAMLEKLALPCRTQDANLRLLWESNQIKLLDGLTKETLPAKTVNLLVNSDHEYVRAILTAALDENDDEMLIKMVQAQLIQLKPHDLQKLAAYYQTDPKPTLTELSTLLTQKRPLIEMINYYERVVQAGNKRIYSINEKGDGQDAEDIQRVLNGFKLKGQRNLTAVEKAGLLNTLYYINTYSQVRKLAERSPEELLDLIQTNKSIGTEEAKAKVLACMREMVLRKTGKWANHTQMLDLIYGVMHNDENLLHQIRTGEGKSIIALMRVAYRALNGQVVDVFSSKESLSSRDHQEFSPVFDAFGIPHSHITDKSNPEDYCNASNGAVHYATIGNFSLFLSGLSWDAKAQFDTHAENRVAFMDEADHIMRFENTLFNYSDQADATSVYNFDAWVYQVTYDFYLENKECLAENKFEISEKPNLEALYQKLQAASLSIAPDKSNFFQKYLASGDVTLRNQKLLKLLSAAHMAKGLEEGVEFCVMDDQKKISDSVTLDTRFAKVMINNQVYHGSTYSELVQQFLHVRLNQEAIAAGERPNFFIEPESEIALSLNARYVLKNYYKHLEGCTGTPGNEEALAFYKREFGIDTVIKLPTHEEVKTIFLPPVYAENEAEQIARIIESIRFNPAQPILITCEDDKAVDRMGKAIQQALLGERGVVLDTNAQGLSEAEIVKDAGKAGAVTISSRMGRGTDIKPDDLALGLKVIRTYPAAPEVEKQEKGRQGRNAAGGVCEDIINYEPIKLEVEKYLLESDVRFAALLEYETGHLDEKLAKHQGDNNLKWRMIREDSGIRKQYLHTRTLLRLQHQLKAESKQRTNERDDLIAEGSGQVIEYLSEIPAAVRSAFKQEWKACKQAIEAIWATDLDGSQSRALLDEFYASTRIQPPHPDQMRKHPSEAHYLQGNEDVCMEALIAFHQAWLTTRSEYERRVGPSVTALYGEDGEQLDNMYQAFSLLNAEQVATFTHLVKTYPNCHSISGESWVAAMDFLVNDPDIAETYAARLDEFFTKNPRVPKDASEFRAFNKLFIAAVAGTPDIEFIREIVHDTFPVRDHRVLLEKVNLWPRAIVELCKTCMTQEDIVFFLNKINTSKALEPRCIEYLVKNHKVLKAEPYMIRPLIGALFQKNLENTPLSTLDCSKKTAELLSFFNQRPGYTSRDYRDVQAKVDRIVNEEDQAKFLTLLAWIPPYIPARVVLKDLMDLPGRYSFDNGGVALQQRIHRMQVAATAFNDFLFAYGLIASKDVFTTPINEEEYKNWCGIFFNFPTLEQREHFFTTVNKFNHADIGFLKRLADAYSEDLTPEGLQVEMNKLGKNKTTDDSPVTVVDPSLRRPGFFV